MSDGLDASAPAGPRFDARRLLDWPFQPIIREYTDRDTILYALGLGLGADPLDPMQLRFAYEQGLIALPTMAVTLANAGFWLQEERACVDWRRVLHGEQGLVMHRPLPAAGRVVGLTRNDAVVDKGPGRGALLYTTTELTDATTRVPICTLTSTVFLRGEGGFGGKGDVGPRTSPSVPDRAPDHTFNWPISPQAALLYRLTGDFNPLHADPALAREAGFDRPILHGLATYGVAGYSLACVLCAGETERLTRLDARFTAPAYPGETLRTEVWEVEPGRAAFRVRSAERDMIVLIGIVEYLLW